MNIVEKTFETIGTLQTRSKTTLIVLHHAYAINCTVEDIDRWHKNRGWCKIGYQFFVRKDGTIYRGREENAVGAHAYGYNSISIGICAEGNYDVEQMSEAQKNAIIDLVSYLKNKYGITEVKKHKDLNNTRCPGANYPFDEIVAKANGDVEFKTINPIEAKSSESRSGNVAADNLVKELQHELNVQKNAGLVEDGIFGPKTANAMINVRLGARGNITKIIQKALIKKGYSIYGGIDGIFGNDTDRRVKDFQRNNGLSADGIVGRQTIEKLLK